MTGKYILEISNQKVAYELELERNITVLQGNSGTGKSTFYRLVRDAVSPTPVAGCHCNMRERLSVLDRGDEHWGLKIQKSHGKIFVADESSGYIYSKEFAELASTSDNYFVLISRRPLGNLAYSVSCIHGLYAERVGDKIVNKMYQRYTDTPTSVVPNVILAEDSNSGYEMISLAFDCKVVSAHGNSNVSKELDNLSKVYNSVYAVVDGAAFGAHVARAVKTANLAQNAGRVLIYAPDSFEYLLLKAPYIYRSVEDKLSRTYDYCDSCKFKSWERFYTDLLSTWMLQTKGIPYTKGELQAFFKSPTFINHIKNSLVDLK